MPVKPRPIAERFWEKVDIRGENECWPWMACCGDNGYGKFQLRRDKQVYAHRMAYELTYKKKLKTEDVVRHKVCDNPPCCNPKHLRKGSHFLNHVDKVKRGRYSCGIGEGNGSAKLTEKKIIKILLSKKTVTALALELDVRPVTISNVQTGQTWAHVRPDIARRKSRRGGGSRKPRGKFSVKVWENGRGSIRGRNEGKVSQAHRKTG